jgi:uncharacterized protein (TIGR02265 family)
MTFTDPPWAAPFDSATELSAIAEDATISGMFPAPLLALAQRKGVTLPSARDRYVPFKFYPLREHARLLLETCAAIYPSVSPRQALRKIGHHAPSALLSSTLGKVMLGSAEGVHDAVGAMAKAYAVNVPTARVTVREQGEHHAILSLEGVSYFLDSHHVGVFEGVLRHAGVEGAVTISVQDRANARFKLTW